MADYTPVTTFTFNGTAYTPSTAFDFDTATGSIEPQTATLSATLDSVTAVFVGHNAAQGTIGATLDGVNALFTGFIPNIGVIAGLLDGPTANIIASIVTNRGTIQNVTLEDTVGGIIGNYDPNVKRWVTAKNNALWQDATARIDLKTAMLRDQGTRIDLAALAVQENGTLTGKTTVLSTDRATRNDAGKVASAQQAGTPLTDKTKLSRDQATVTNAEKVGSNQQDGLFIYGKITSVKQQMTKVYPNKWTVINQYSGEHQFDFLHLVYPDGNDTYKPNRWNQIGFDFVENNYAPTAGFSFTHRTHDYNAISHNYGVTRATFNAPLSKAKNANQDGVCSIIQATKKPDRGRSIWIDYPRPDPPPTPPSGTTVTVPIKEAYTMQHIINTTLEDLTVIDLANVSLSFNADSFAWQFTAELLDHSQLDLVKPLSDGTAIKLVITINGYKWKVLVESVSHSREFAKRKIVLSGRGLSALLAAPYVKSSTATQADLLTVQQLAELHLPLGWTLNWQTTTWLVDGGAYGYQGRTPIQALSDMVKTIGAMIVPDRESQILTIKPRYPVLPWNFAGTTADLTIPDAAILELTHRQTSRQYANGIYIHGSEIGGELGFCRLNGTAGDVLLETVSDPLMTDVIGIRAAAERLLAGEYTQPDISSIKTPMDGVDFPLAVVGDLIAITVGGATTKGIVNGVKVDGNLPNVSQEITIGEQTNNAWIAFQDLLPKDPLLVGTVVSTTGTTSVMTLIDGGIINVRGTGTVASKYYIRSGVIQGEAPNMVQNEVVI